MSLFWENCQYWLIRPKFSRICWGVELGLLLTPGVNGVSAEEMVEISGLVEQLVIELTRTDCIVFRAKHSTITTLCHGR